MEVSLFTAKDYREFLQSKLASSSQSWGMVTKMAQAAGCQRSQLSRVLSGQINLTPDQAYGLCEFWALSEVEAKYFLKLVEHARAATKSYREKIESELRVMKRSQEDLSIRLKRPQIGESEVQSIYYSSWLWAAVHILVSIPEYRTINKISQRLSLDPIQVVEVLKVLKGHGLVKEKNDEWSFNSFATHLPQRSPFVSLHHANWRQRAVLSSQSPLDEGVHYTVVQSVSLPDFQKIKDLILNLIDAYTKIASPSKEEELACFLCDWFRV